VKIIYARTHILHPHLLAAWEELKDFCFDFLFFFITFELGVRPSSRERYLGETRERERARACTKKESEKEPRDPDQHR